MTAVAQDLAGALRAVGVSDPAAIATQAAAAGIGAADIPKLAEIARRRGARSPSGLLVHWLRTNEARDVLAAADCAPVAAPPPPAVGSDLANVDATNSYGWSPRTARIMSVEDHDEPGRWNAYRQSYNLDAAEREQRGARDHRRRGCSRVEVLGSEPNTRSAVDYDADAVEAAIARQGAGQ